LTYRFIYFCARPFLWNNVPFVGNVKSIKFGRVEILRMLSLWCNNLRFGRKNAGHEMQCHGQNICA